MTVIKDYKKIDDYVRNTKLGVEKFLDDFLIYSYPDVNPDAQLTQNSYRLHYYEISLEINEGCSFQIDSFYHPLKSNRLTIISPNRLQTLVAKKDLLQESKGFSIFFERDFLGTHFNEGIFKKEFRFLRPDFSPSLQLSDKQLHELVNLFDIIKYEQKEYGDKSREVIRNLTKVIFEKAITFDKQVQEKVISSPLVSQFLQLCSSSFLELHAVKDYASKLSVTPKHLTEIVKDQTGKTALETIHQLKIGYAKGLLKQTNLSVKQIAFELGFDNPEYFNVFFKKLTGETPNQFRQI